MRLVLGLVIVSGEVVQWFWRFIVKVSLCEAQQRNNHEAEVSVYPVAFWV